MKKSDIDQAVNAAHARISEYLTGASQGGEISSRKIAEVIDRAFVELKQTLDAAAGIPPQR